MRDPALVKSIMSSITDQGGKADRALGSALWRSGLRYRRKTTLFGKPDLVFPASRVVVFVDGDFWHGRYLERHLRRGDFKRNTEYWLKKLQRNIDRDATVTRTLQNEGWLVIRVWESDVLKNLSTIATDIENTVRARQNASRAPMPSRQSQ